MIDNVELNDIQQEIEILSDELSKLPDFVPGIYQNYRINQLISSLDISIGSTMDDLLHNYHWARGTIYALKEDEEEYRKLIKERDEAIQESKSKIINIAIEEISKINDIEVGLISISSKATNFIKENRNRLISRIDYLFRKTKEIKLKSCSWIIQCLENNFEKVELLWIFDRSELPKISGVYLLISLNGLEYIGQSKNIKQRLNKSHQVFEENKHWVGIIKVNNNYKRIAMERYLIGLLEPRYNKQRYHPYYQRSMRFDAHSPTE